MRVGNFEQLVTKYNYKRLLKKLIHSAVVRMGGKAMSDLEISKKNILTQLKGLCAHCTNHRPHSCRVQRIAMQIKAIRGVPLIVNNEFKGVLWA